MPDLLQKTSRLEANIKKLITLHSRLKEDILTLKSENKQLKVTIHEQQEQIRQLNDGKMAQHIANALHENPEKGDSAALKKKINEMIREVDKCLSVLNK